MNYKLDHFRLKNLIKLSEKLLSQMQHMYCTCKSARRYNFLGVALIKTNKLTKNVSLKVVPQNTKITYISV